MIFSVGPVFAAPEDLYNARGKRDPFVPLVTMSSRPTAAGLIGVESIDEIKVEGIIYDPENGSFVIVNGSVMKEGEEQGTVKVLKIEAGGAYFSINGLEGFKTQYPSEQPKKDKQ